MAWVPTARAGAVGVAVPPETLTAVPTIVVPSNSSTCPVGVPPVTATLYVNAVPEATVSPFTVNLVVVGVSTGGGGVPVLLLHPAVKLIRQTRPKPSAAR